MEVKNRISKYIVPIIQKCIDENDVKTYYEPFVGGANMIDKIKCENRIGNDIHKELIAMWNELQKGWIPPNHITEEEYISVRDNKEKYSDYYVGFVGYHATFGSKYFAGYARSFKADGITPRDQSNEAYRNTMKQVPNIMDVLFTQGDYKEYRIKNAVIYCDPHIKEQQNMKQKLLIMMSSGTGVEKWAKRIGFLSVNIMRQMTLNVYGQRNI